MGMADSFFEPQLYDFGKLESFKGYSNDDRDCKTKFATKLKSGRLKKTFNGDLIKVILMHYHQLMS